MKTILLTISLISCLQAHGKIENFDALLTAGVQESDSLSQQISEKVNSEKNKLNQNNKSKETKKIIIENNSDDYVPQNSPDDLFSSQNYSDDKLTNIKAKKLDKISVEIHNLD